MWFSFLPLPGRRLENGCKAPQTGQLPPLRQSPQSLHVSWLFSVPSFVSASRRKKMRATPKQAKVPLFSRLGDVIRPPLPVPYFRGSLLLARRTRMAGHRLAVGSGKRRPGFPASLLPRLGHLFAFFIPRASVAMIIFMILVAPSRILYTLPSLSILAMGYSLEYPYALNTSSPRSGTSSAARHA